MAQSPVRIAGRLVRTDAVLEVRNPHGGDLVGAVPRCTAEHVDAACRGAAAALARDDLPQYVRAEILERAADLLEGREEELARGIALEAGKPLRTARVEARRCVDTFVFAAVEARRLGGEVVPLAGSASGQGRLGLALRVPIGVVAAITPFNFPLNLVAHKVAPAIAAGCPVVLKPASQTPLTALRLHDVLIEAGLPDDWMSVVTGGGAETGEPLVRHPVPRLVSFTGSPAVGWEIPAKAPRKKVDLELGSTSPVIVEPDADIEAVARKVRSGGYAHAGQSCISVQWVLVHEEVHARFVDALVGEVETLVLGDPSEDATEMGPMIAPRETERVLSWIREAESAGGRVRTGGRVRPDGILEPTVLDALPDHVRLRREEAFGPVVGVTSYRDIDEAIDRANDSRLRIHAGVFTTDLSRAMRAARRLDYGGVLIGEIPTSRADQQPYGGVCDAGNTREGPAWAVRDMTVLRFVSVPW